MILGQSIFDAVMARLKEEWESENDASPQSLDSEEWGSVRGFKSSYVPSTAYRDDEDSTSRLDSFYFAFPAEPKEEKPQESGAAVPGAPPFDERPFQRLSLEEIAADLGITEADTAAILLDRRRKFARSNHPDRVPPLWRDKANMRMKIANLLIDEAIKRVMPAT